MSRYLYSLGSLVLMCGPCFAQSTQSPEGLKEYVPILPSVRAKFWAVDPKLGYAVKDVGGGVNVVSTMDGNRPFS